MGHAPDGRRIFTVIASDKLDEYGRVLKPNCSYYRRSVSFHE
jgi:hypothetical protein